MADDVFQGVDGALVDRRDPTRSGIRGRVRLQLQADLDDVEGRDDEARYQAGGGSGDENLRSGALRIER